MNVPRTRRSRFSGNPVSRKDTDPVKTAPQFTGHKPVLLHESLALLDVQSDDAVLDATLGGAGHAQEIVRRLGPEGAFVGFDLDHDAIERARKALAGSKAPTHLIEANFRDLKRELEARGIRKITKALFDLGWSGYQLDSGRGFSLRADEPLLMTYSKCAGPVTAATAVNGWKEESLADILYGFGEERHARRIARAIVERRAAKPFTSARELADFIFDSVPPGYRHGRLHPATRTFQALRIAVNDELGALRQGLESALDVLAKGGRLAVITFHSVEDRAVKQLFAEFEREGRGKRLTKKPVAPSKEELKTNRRARSAKLRVFEKNTHDKKTSQNKQIQTLNISGQV